MKDLFAKVCDRNEAITDKDLNKVFTHFEADLDKRRPSPAVTEAGFQGTDLDLASFLQAVARRGAVINIPYYKSRRPSTTREGESVVSKSNRHGKIIGLTANKEVFSFGIKIIDANIITTDTVGAPRNFMLVDIDGSWYEGWRCVEWKPDAKENEFLTKNKLWTDNQVIFKNFVHPGLANSIFCTPYKVSKAMINRFEEESKFLFSDSKRIEEAGYKLPDSQVKDWPKTEVGESKSIKVPAFKAELDLPIIGDFVKRRASQKAMIEIYEDRKKLIYNTLPKLRFITRCVEMAYKKHNRGIPQWITGDTWEDNYKLPGKKVVWNRLMLDTNIYLRTRDYNKSERVAV